MNKQENKFEDLSNKIIGAAIEVHKILGPGFIESVYHNALKKELELKEIPFETEKEIKINYKNNEVGTHRLDLIIEDQIIVELKAVENISKVHIAQVISYMKATGLGITLILNFSKTKVEIRRITPKTIVK
ncbi:MAG: GxxExxY protein [Thermoplasmata archaeon]|nr:MAG: GxxExxY protein [Thermoplasmata archaeon]